MNWKKYYENIAHDENNKMLPNNRNTTFNLSLPKQIVQLWKTKFKITKDIEEEALTKFLAYGKIFIVKEACGQTRILDEFSNELKYRCEDDTLFLLEYVMTRKIQNGTSIVDQKETHQIIRRDNRIEHITTNVVTNEETVEVIDEMPKMFYLSLMGKKGVPCYYNGVQLIGEISQLYQVIMMKFEQQEYAYLQVLQHVLQESQLLNIQLTALGHLLGITDMDSILTHGIASHTMFLQGEERIVEKGKEMLRYLQ